MSDRGLFNHYPDEFGTKIENSILTAPYNPNRVMYKVREAAQEAKRLGRPLSVQEMERFIVDE